MRFLHPTIFNIGRAVGVIERVPGLRNAEGGAQRGAFNKERLRTGNSRYYEGAKIFIAKFARPVNSFYVLRLLS